MPHEPYEPPEEEMSHTVPSGAVRERVLSACRRELAARHRRAR